MEQVHIEGWKGESGLEISFIDSLYLIREYRKQKHSGEIVMHETHIPKGVVENLRSILRFNCPIGRDFSYREMVELIKKDYGLVTDTDAFNGGRNRKVYFAIYYYPLKVLEKEGFVSYSGRGVVRRLREA